MKPYFYVFRVGGCAPKEKHATIESAHAEAVRLATKHPGESFEVLECLGVSRAVTAQTFWMDGVTPPKS